MAALNIKWQDVQSIAVTPRNEVVVTGEDADEGLEEEAQSSEPKLRWNDRPILVYVCEDTLACADSEKFETIVLKDEKIALGVRAFRCVRMSPDQVDEDAILDGAGKDVPRVLVIDPIKVKVKVLESKDLKASKLFKAMKSVSNKFWKEKLDKVVKEHISMLTEQDQLANADKTLADKEERAAEDEAKLEKVKAERKEVTDQLKDLLVKQRELWKLTPKHTV